MIISVIDKSSYLRGLLILAKKDNHLSENEKKIILDAGKRLGFSTSFCSEILETILHNECVCDEPVQFLSKTVAKSFIEDGIKLCLSGKHLTDEELDWLKKSAEINDIDKKWFDKQISKFEGMINNSSISKLTLYSLV